MDFEIFKYFDVDERYLLIVIYYVNNVVIIERYVIDKLECDFVVDDF